MESGACRWQQRSSSATGVPSSRPEVASLAVFPNPARTAGVRFSLTRPLYQTVNFWISVGLFVYFSGSFFYILLVEDFFRKSHRILMEFRQISTAIVLLKNLVLSFAVCVKEMPEETGEYEFNIPLDMNLDSFESFTPKNNLN